MRVNVKQIDGEWDLGFVLDQHSTGSVQNGHHANGHAKYDTDYTEVGGMVHQFKYRSDFSRVPALAKAVNTHIVPKLGNIDFVVPMAPSKVRKAQPVTTLAKYLAKVMEVQVELDFLVKRPGSSSLKDIETRWAKEQALKGTLSLARDLKGNGPFDILLLDDLFDTGASLDAACKVLRKCEKIRTIYVAALTWTRN
jgi:predicted amidophosphoribosyltransferase